MGHPISQGLGGKLQEESLSELLHGRKPFWGLSEGSAQQGNRVKDSSCDEACEEFVVPSGGFAL